MCAWSPAWEDLDEVDRLEEEDRLECKDVDDHGFRIRTLKERLYRALAMVVFILVFPFVFVILGIYRMISLIGSGREKW